MAHLNQLSELLNSQRESGSMTDVTVVCGEKEFPAHKLILSATSNYFRTMFSSGCTEGTNTRIELPSVTAKEMEIILQFIYMGNFNDVDDQPFLCETV